jgi:hypothetical protein
MSFTHALGDTMVRQPYERASISRLKINLDTRRSGWHRMSGFLPSPSKDEALGRNYFNEFAVVVPENSIR